MFALLTTMEWVATGMTIVGVYLISVPHIKGQYIMFFAQLIWYTFSIYNNHWGLALQSALLIMLNLNGIRNWRMKNIG